MKMMTQAFSRLVCRSIFNSTSPKGCGRIFLLQICLLSSAILLALCGSGSAVSAGDGDGAAVHPSTLVIGKVSSDPRKHYRYLKPMVDYAAAQMKDLGIRNGSVLMARDNAQMMDFLRQGKVDWITETAYSSLLYEQHNIAEILLRKWKKDAAQYHTIFFARKESPIQSLADLRGKVLALEDPGSTTAFFDPLMCLIQDGVDFQRLSNFRQRPAAGKVGYVLSRQEINSSVWVHKGLVDAAAFNNQDWNKSDHMYKNMRDDLKIFHRSAPIPRAFELVRTTLRPAIKERLKSVLLKAHLDKNARKALQSYQETRQFDELEGKSLQTMKAMRNAIISNSGAIQ